MKLKYILTVTAIVAVTKASFAQYSQDAIRFSTFQYGSTSRIKALGNAGIAVGGDLSSVTTNPAGIGFFTKSEFSLTPELDNSKVNSSYFGQENTATKTTFNLNNAAFVIYNRLNSPRGKDKTKGWLSLNFGAAYARTNDFHQNVYYAGKSNGSSVADYFAELANNSNTIENGYATLPTGNIETIAWNQYLIDSVGASGNKAIYAPNTATKPDQMNYITRSGGQSELALSVGANYSNKLYLGFALGITNLHYNSTSVFTESGLEYVYFNTNYTSNYTIDQATRGTGINGKFGIIYKPVSAVRLAATVTTPTYYSIDDNTFIGLATRINGQPDQNDGTNYALSYNLTTPWKFSGGIAAFVGNLGFITADVDYIDYSSTHLSGDYNFTNDNSDIKLLYKSAVNFRGGAEARITNNFFLRGGYGIQGSPQESIQSSIKTATGGLGYRVGNYYIDATYAHISGSSTEYPYVLSSSNEFQSPAANLKTANNNVYLTFGIRF